MLQERWPISSLATAFLYAHAYSSRRQTPAKSRRQFPANFNATHHLNHSSAHLIPQVFTHGQPSSQCTAALSSDLNMKLLFANNSHEQSNVVCMGKSTGFQFRNFSNFRLLWAL